MEGWDRKAGWNRDVLERIVALLFALANLADLAADAPFLKRRQVLGILRPAETATRAYVLGVAFGVTIPADAPDLLEAPGEAGDASRIAASFRALALALCALLTRVALRVRRAFAGPRADRRMAVRPVGVHAPPLAFDTS